MASSDEHFQTCCHLRELRCLLVLQGYKVDGNIVIRGVRVFSFERKVGEDVRTFFHAGTSEAQ